MESAAYRSVLRHNGVAVLLLCDDIYGRNTLWCRRCCCCIF